jgi:hypothetical protein
MANKKNDTPKRDAPRLKAKRPTMSMPMSEGKKRSVRESKVRPEINAARASDTKKRAAAKKKSLADNSSGQRRVAVAKKADPGSRGRSTTVATPQSRANKMWRDWG